MLYAERDGSGKVVAVRAEAVNPNQPQISDEELLVFLASNNTQENCKAILGLLDASVARVVEDLIELLVRKNIILFTDLPESAQEKLDTKKQIRQRMQKKQHIIVDDIL